MSKIRNMVKKDKKSESHSDQEEQKFREFLIIKERLIGVCHLMLLLCK